jgi:hypothetical protein
MMYYLQLHSLEEHLYLLRIGCNNAFFILLASGEITAPSHIQTLFPITIGLFEIKGLFICNTPFISISLFPS